MNNSHIIRAPRLNIAPEEPVILKMDMEHGQMQCLVMNISITGLAIVPHPDLALGDVIHCEMITTDKSIKIQVEVKQTTDYSYGLHVLDDLLCYSEFVCKNFGEYLMLTMMEKHVDEQDPPFTIKRWSGEEDTEVQISIESNSIFYLELLSLDIHFVLDFHKGVFLYQDTETELHGRLGNDLPHKFKLFLNYMAHNLPDLEFDLRNQIDLVTGGDVRQKAS